jgi:Flp pilus assembly protein TadD
VPDFSPVLLTQGKVALTRGEPEIAVKRLRRAAELNPLPEYQWWLADALDVSGKGSEAANVRSQIVDAGVRSDPRTTALYLATSHRDASTAIELCQAELEVRADVQTHDALAWSLYAAGDFAHAAEESRAALALGTADSRLRLHAAMIALATGRREDAAALLAKCEPAALRPSERQLYGDTATRLGIAGQRITARSTVSLCRR